VAGFPARVGVLSFPSFCFLLVPFLSILFLVCGWCGWGRKSRPMPDPAPTVGRPLSFMQRGSWLLPFSDGPLKT